jgi:hypothetical protein
MVACIDIISHLSLATCYCDLSADREQFAGSYKLEKPKAVPVSFGGYCHGQGGVLFADSSRSSAKGGLR